MNASRLEPGDGKKRYQTMLTFYPTDRTTGEHRCEIQDDAEGTAAAKPAGKP